MGSDRGNAKLEDDLGQSEVMVFAGWTVKVTAGYSADTDAFMADVFLTPPGPGMRRWLLTISESDLKSALAGGLVLGRNEVVRLCAVKG